MKLDLPAVAELKSNCRAMAVLDAIFSTEWDYRYSTFNMDWSDDEQFYEMQNGEGDHLLILFRKDGCVINGFSQAVGSMSPSGLTHIEQELPPKFREFIFNEPVVSLGTTFCSWLKVADGNPGNPELVAGDWRVASHHDLDQQLTELTYLLIGGPDYYKLWAEDYFEDFYHKSGISQAVVQAIFSGHAITRRMVLELNPSFADWSTFISELNELQFAHKL